MHRSFEYATLPITITTQQNTRKIHSQESHIPVQRHHFPFTTCTITIIVYKRYMYYYAYTDCSAHSLCNTSLSCLPTCTGRLVSGGFSAGSGVRKGWFCSYQLFTPRKARLLTVKSWYLERTTSFSYTCLALPTLWQCKTSETEMRETCYSSNCGIRTTEDKRVA